MARMICEFDKKGRHFKFVYRKLNGGILNVYVDNSLVNIITGEKATKVFEKNIEL